MGVFGVTWVMKAGKRRGRGGRSGTVTVGVRVQGTAPAITG